MKIDVSRFAAIEKHRSVSDIAIFIFNLTNDHYSLRIEKGFAKTKQTSFEYWNIIFSISTICMASLVFVYPGANYVMENARLLSHTSARLVSQVMTDVMIIFLLWGVACQAQFINALQDGYIGLGVRWFRQSCKCCVATHTHTLYRNCIFPQLTSHLLEKNGIGFHFFPVEQHFNSYTVPFLILVSVQIFWQNALLTVVVAPIMARSRCQFQTIQNHTSPKTNQRLIRP